MVGVFAAIDANGWVMIIGAVTLAIIQVLAAWRNNVKTDQAQQFLQERIEDNTNVTREVAHTAKIETVQAAKVVAEKLVRTTEESVVRASEQLDKVSEALNGNLHDKLNLLTEQLQLHTERIDTLDERFAFIQESLVKLMVKSEA